ncbi:exopolygalacturonase-like [Prunus yedoensis var. nudiflora]|uniref:Exopolygalacturonase-like n=1 Tax=Prunus yedoensis var. nudiflora TaxID=2094558 RepID=A0A314UWN7_PRUYE|nr:exopolygalacturonase-like [Prunus yedoensis var. nudiflora]
MGLKLKNVLPMFMFLLLVSIAKAQPAALDVTSAKYGGKPDFDITQALSKAWTDACASTSPSKLVVPKGTFKFLGTTFKGPCKAPIAFQLQGTLQAPADGNQLPKKDTWISFDHIDRLTISGGGTFDGQGAISWKQNDCHKNKNCKSIAINLRFNFITNSRIEYVTTKDSKNFHVNVLGCTNVAFHHFTVSAPKESINTDGIHIGRSTGISIIDSTIKTGDDCISIGDGTKNLNVTNVTCGPGHGISIGSLGRYPKEEPVSGITIKNCTLTDTQNGVRIKTWPASPAAGTASDIHFEDIIMVNVGNPILIDQEYCPWNQCTLKVPSKVKISNVSFKNIRGTSTTPLAVKLVCSKGLPCEKVELSDIDLKYTGNQGPLTSKCTNVKPTITRVTKPLSCATFA